MMRDMDTGKVEATSPGSNILSYFTIRIIENMCSNAVSSNPFPLQRDPLSLQRTHYVVLESTMHMRWLKMWRLQTWPSLLLKMKCRSCILCSSLWRNTESCAAASCTGVVLLPVSLTAEVKTFVLSGKSFLQVLSTSCIWSAASLASTWQLGRSLALL